MAITTANLVAEWHGSYATGTGPNSNGAAATRDTWVDICGVYDLTASGCAWSAGNGEWAGAGTAGDPYCFISDGVDAKFTKMFTHDNPINLDGAWTIEMWAYPVDKDSDKSLISLWDDDGNSNIFTRSITTTGYFNYYYNDAAANASSNTSTARGDITGAWKHLVVTYASETLAVYVNGTAGSGASFAGWADPWTASIDTVEIASSCSHRISVVRMYSAELSSGDVTNNYNAGILANASSVGAPGFTGITVIRDVHA